MVKVMTLILAVNAGLELLYMNNPELGQYSKILSPEDQEQTAPINFQEYGFIVGVIFEIEGHTTIPSEVGRLVAKSTHGLKPEIHDLLDCRELIGEGSIKKGPKELQSALSDGLAYCLDPAKASTTVFMSGESKPLQKEEISIMWINCADDTPERIASLNCKDRREVALWMQQNDVEMHAYVNDVKINFSSKADYYHESTEYVETSWLSGEQHILLQLNNV